MDAGKLSWIVYCSCRFVDTWNATGTRSVICIELIYIFWVFQSGYTLGVVHIGAPACGMNAAVRSFVRNCIYRGDTVMGIHDGIEGLIAGNVSPQRSNSLH